MNLNRHNATDKKSLPPTVEAIELQRLGQLKTIRDLRRRLTECNRRGYNGLAVKRRLTGS